MVYGYTPTNVTTVYTAGSGRIRGWLRDCEGEPITQSQVSAIAVTIWQVAMGTYTAVPNYSNKSVPTTAIMDEPLIDCDERLYNLDFDPYDGEHPPFPTRDAYYIVEVVFTSTGGNKSVHQIKVHSE